MLFCVRTGRELPSLTKSAEVSSSRHTRGKPRGPDQVRFRSSLFMIHVATHGSRAHLAGLMLISARHTACIPYIPCEHALQHLLCHLLDWAALDLTRANSRHLTTIVAIPTADIATRPPRSSRAMSDRGHMLWCQHHLIPPFQRTCGRCAVLQQDYGVATAHSLDVFHSLDYY